MKYSPRAGMRMAALRLLSGVLLALTPIAAVRGAAPEPAGQLLVMSDIHFNPMAQPQLVDRLAATEPEKWRAILESVGDHRFAQYGSDTNWPLLASALQQMRRTLPHPAFVLLPGDFLAHQFRQKFDAAARAHSPADYRSFVRKTMQFLALQFEHEFPGVAVLPVVGNNDEDCGDYRLQANGPFLADTLPVVRALLGPAGRQPAFEHDWLSYGNAAVSVHGLRVLLANTVFFSRDYRNACGSPSDGDPGQATLGWLAAELAAARRSHQPVWLVYHIPPGIDGYATWRNGSCPDHILPMWKDRYAQPFSDLLRRYRDTIAASFAGHTHMDDFRLSGDGGSYSGFVLITPALSPIFGQNPAFRTVVFDAGGDILDQTTYDLSNLGAIGADAAPQWQAEYTFTREWRLPGLGLPSLQRLYAMITTMPEDRSGWHRLFPVSSPVYWALNRGGADQVRALDCATGHVPIADFRRCWCGGKP